MMNRVGNCREKREVQTFADRFIVNVLTHRLNHRYNLYHQK